MARLFRVLTIIVGAILLTFNARATHLFGGELYYTWVSGNTYQLTLVLYGDCSGTATAFAGLSTATPQIQVLNGTTVVNTVTLSVQNSGVGANVSPVCPDEAANTTCDNGTLPGVKKFTYKGNVTLTGASANWKFRSLSDFLNNTVAGRSNNITNVVVGTSSTTLNYFCLEATLNNTSATNSSPTFTSIPTPFFCINKQQQYNQGAVDPNGDSLAFALVPGINGAYTAFPNVTYISPYTATAPLATSTGSFSFNTATGQLNFYPNLVQRSLVVTRASEYRNGTLVGTSMREMVFVVLNNCNNTPPSGTISNPSTGTVNGNTIDLCKFGGTFSFGIATQDPDSDNVTLSYNGLPTGATATISNNGTSSPTFNFSWDITNVTPGSYTFYLNLEDDGCPLTSKQTVAYVINIHEVPGINYSLISEAECLKKGVFTVAPVGTDTPYTFTALQGTTTVLTRNNVTGTITDSLSAGTYTFRLTSAEGCIKDTSITFQVNVQITPTVAMTLPYCVGGSTGTITVSGTGPNTPMQYAIGSQAYTGSGTFTGLTAGTYTVHIKDATGCVKDTTVVLADPLAMIPVIAVKRPICSPVSNGIITVNSVTNGTAPYQYALNTGSYSTSNTFTALGTGTYTVHIKDAHDCVKDTTVTLTDSLQMSLAATVTNVLCYGGNTGQVILQASGTTSPYTYAQGAGTFGTTNSFSSLTSGSYVFHVQDANGCLKDTAIAITQPTELHYSLVVTPVNCHGGSDGSVTITATGGTTPYSYAVGAGSYQSANVLTGLGAGTYTIYIRDANLCLKDTVITITQPATAITFTPFTVTMPTCEGYADGKIIMGATGGTPGYYYKINGTAYGASPEFDSLVEGTYTLYVKDSRGCVIDTNVTLTGYPHILIDGVSMTEPSCNGYNDGSIGMNVSGGLPPFTYRINNSNVWQATQTFSNKAAGTYVLSAKDANQCIKDTTVELLQPDVLLMGTTAVGNDCNGVDDGGMITLTATGGTRPYSYSWAHNSSLTDSILTGLVNGVYKVTLTDANGCTDEATITIAYNDCCRPFLPNAFSPNADGINDEFNVIYKGDMYLQELNIFNRYGQRVFSASSPDKKWDGTFNGAPCEVGTYFYYVRLLCGNRSKKEIIFRGDLNLVK
ncbi:MAG: gliding motility-associated C-terminal domain-containing protein [Edaphocola sp.]